MADEPTIENGRPKITGQIAITAFEGGRVEISTSPGLPGDVAEMLLYRALMHVERGLAAAAMREQMGPRVELYRGERGLGRSPLTS